MGGRSEGHERAGTSVSTTSVSRIICTRLVLLRPRRRGGDRVHGPEPSAGKPGDQKDGDLSGCCGGPSPPGEGGGKGGGKRRGERKEKAKDSGTASPGRTAAGKPAGEARLASSDRSGRSTLAPDAAVGFDASSTRDGPGGGERRPNQHNHVGDPSRGGGATEGHFAWVSGRARNQEWLRGPALLRTRWCCDATDGRSEARGVVSLCNRATFQAGAWASRRTAPEASPNRGRAAPGRQARIGTRHLELPSPSSHNSLIKSINPLFLLRPSFLNSLRFIKRSRERARATRPEKYPRHDGPW